MLPWLDIWKMTRTIFFYSLNLRTNISSIHARLRITEFCQRLKLSGIHKKTIASQNSPEYESFSASLSKSQRASPLVYGKLVLKKGMAPTKSQQKWQSDCNMKDDGHVKWCKAHQLASKCTKSTRLVEFQFKLLHSNKPISKENWY